MKTSNTEISVILSPETNFLKEIEELIASSNDMIDSVISWINRKGIEMEQVIPLIKGNAKLKLRLTAEAENLHFLKRKKEND